MGISPLSIVIFSNKFYLDTCSNKLIAFHIYRYPSFHTTIFEFHSFVREKMYIQRVYNVLILVNIDILIFLLKKSTENEGRCSVRWWIITYSTLRSPCDILGVSLFVYIDLGCVYVVGSGL